MKKDELSTNFFWASLNFFMDQEKSQRIFAKKMGISPSTLTNYKTGIRIGNEATKRLIAAKLGYPEGRYLEFLELGRAILSGDDPQAVLKTHSKHGFGPEIMAIDWLAPHLNTLKLLDKTDRDIVIGIIQTYAKKYAADAQKPPAEEPNPTYNGPRP
jgi:transcriptional regulator with XRE-family HTH domain